MSNWGATILFVLKKLSEFATARRNAMKEQQREIEVDEIVKNPEKHHSDLFGKSSGVVRIDRRKEDD